MADDVRAIPGCSVGGATRLIGVLGWPVSHSRSPAMHNAAFAELGLDYVYVPLPVMPGHLQAAIGGLLALGFAGANVTVPHKEAVLPYLDELSPEARAIGSVNTIVVRRDGTLWGDSTDGPGLIADLHSHGIEPAGTQVLLLGAGGAARAGAYALAAAGASVAVVNRTFERAISLCERIRQTLPGAGIEAYPFPASLATLSAAAGLIINATSAGLHGSPEAVPWDPAVPFRSDQVVYDLIYRPHGQGVGRASTPLLALAAAAGARTLDGLGMLVQQGARSFELWTGQAAPIDVMAAAALRGS